MEIYGNKNHPLWVELQSKVIQVSLMKPETNFCAFFKAAEEMAKLSDEVRAQQAILDSNV